WGSRSRVKKCAVGERSACSPCAKDCEGNSVSPNAAIAPVTPKAITPKKPKNSAHPTAPCPFHAGGFVPEDQIAVSERLAKRINVLTKWADITTARFTEAS